MKRIFVDTGGFVALLVAEDHMHDRATALFETVSLNRWTLVTTNAVLIETHAVLLTRARSGRRIALSFLDAIQNSPAILVERFSSVTPSASS